MAETKGKQLLASVMPEDKDDNSDDVPPLMTRSDVVKLAYTDRHASRLNRLKKTSLSTNYF